MKLSNYLSVMAVLTIMAAMPAKAQIIINEVLASNGSHQTAAPIRILITGQTLTG